MNPELRSQFDQLKTVHTPSADFVHALESRLADAPVVEPVTDHFPAQIKQVFERAVQLFLPAQFVPVANKFATVVLVLGVTAGGWISVVSATYNTVPGDTLYNVKLATEKVQIVAVEATGDKTKTAKLHTDFAERRANEVKQVIAQNKEPEQAKAAMALLTKSVSDASEALKEAQENPNTTDAAVASTETLLNDTERIAASLREVLETLPPSVSELIDEIVLVQGQLTEKRLSTLQDIVRQQIDGKSSLTPEQTKEIIVRALAQITTDTEVTVTLAKQLNLDIEAAAAGVVAPAPAAKTTESSSSSTPPEETTSTATTSAESTPSTTPIAVVDALELTDISGISDTVSTELREVETLVESGSLLEALTKAKEINTKQVEIESFVKKAVAAQKETTTVTETETPPPAEETSTTPDIPATSTTPTMVVQSLEATSTGSSSFETITP